MKSDGIIPGAEPFSHRAGPVCCVMIHGSYSSPHQFKEFSDYLNQRGYSTAVPLLAGHGRNWKTLHNTTWDELIESARAGFKMAEDLECKQIVLIGFSLGGALAVQLAEEHETDISALVAISAPVFFPKFVKGSLGFASHIFPTLPRFQTDERDAFLFSNNRRTSLHFFSTIVDALPDIREKLLDITMPLFVVQGKSDTTVPCYNARILHREAGAKEKELLIVEGEGHGLLWYKKADDTMKAIADYIDEVTGSN